MENKDSEQIKNNINENEISQDKINKPKELKEFDALPHFKTNIINSDKNCKEEINEYSYYCFTCKHSVCGECGIYEHKDHLLIQRENCLNYDNTFFNEISKVIEDALFVNEKKNEIISIISESIKNLKNKLDEIKNKKIEEVNKLFTDINKNLIELKKNYLNVKSSIEKYYEDNSKFFNILGKNNPNYDLENTIFLMNFEIMNLCDNKNLEVLDNIIQMKNKINNYENTIKERKKELKNQLEHFLDIDYKFDKFDDFYWDVKLRTTKYTEHIKQFKNTISDIIKKTGNYDTIIDLLDIFDSKNKKGKEVIFNQEYFVNNENNVDNLKSKKIRGNSRNKLKTSKSVNLFKNQGNNSSGSSKIYIMNNTFGNINTSFIHINPNNIILDNEVIKRFFAYSILELYSKYFDNNPNKNLELMNNIFCDEKKKNKKRKGKNMIKSNTKNNIKSNNNNYLYPNELMNNIDKNDKNISSNMKEIQSMNKITVSYLNNYNTRYNLLKEYAKPIIGTNYISLFDQNTQKIIKISVNLTIEEHDYTYFPNGCRHILVSNILYITGGITINKELNTVLSFNIITFELKKLNNLNNSHSYHSIEYLDNYDCLIIIGGEVNDNCELFDIYSKKWINIPKLNTPRANVNIFFDNMTSDLYALFGIEGFIRDKKNYSDVIEVLELNDIKSGWIKVDYYKSADLNFKLNYCTVLPFSRDKLLIYGGNDSRFTKKLFALFNMSKNECVKVDTKTLELIKLEEKQMKMVDMALSKIN